MFCVYWVKPMYMNIYNGPGTYTRFRLGLQTSHCSFQIVKFVIDCTFVIDFKNTFPNHFSMRTMEITPVSTQSNCQSPDGATVATIRQVRWLCVYF